MRVKNVCKASLGFPCGALVHPSDTAEVDDAHKNHPVVAGWIADGKIEVDGAEAKLKRKAKVAAQKDDPEKDEPAEGGE